MPPKPDAPYYTLGDDALHTDEHIRLLYKYFDNLEQQLKDGTITQEQIDRRTGDSRGKYVVEIDGVKKAFTCIEKYCYLWVQDAKNDPRCIVPKVPLRYGGLRGIFYKKYTREDETPTSKSEYYVLKPVYPSTSEVEPSDDDIQDTVIDYTVVFLSKTADDNDSKARHKQAPREVRKVVMADIAKMLPVPTTDRWKSIVRIAAGKYIAWFHISFQLCCFMFSK